MADTPINDDLAKCLRLADVADAITMPAFRGVTLHVDTKPDHTPVSEADLAVDKALHDIVVNEYGDAYLSEEGDTTHRAGRQWIIDPIDGTKNFIRRHPEWGTLISVQDETGTLAAAVTAPALGRRWWASRGRGAWTKDIDGTVRRIHVSSVAKLADAYMTYGTLLSWESTPTGVDNILQLMRTTWRERSPGDLLGHAYVAEGVVDCCIEATTKEWDMAALAFIITEAGGSVYTNAAPDTPAEWKRLLITSNGLLERELKQALKL